MMCEDGMEYGFDRTPLEELSGMEGERGGGGPRPSRMHGMLACATRVQGSCA